jgi:hypothetical protein
VLPESHWKTAYLPRTRDLWADKMRYPEVMERGKDKFDLNSDAEKDGPHTKELHPVVG